MFLVLKSRKRKTLQRLRGRNSVKMAPTNSVYSSSDSASSSINIIYFFKILILRYMFIYIFIYYIIYIYFPLTNVILLDAGGGMASPSSTSPLFNNNEKENPLFTADN